MERSAGAVLAGWLQPCPENPNLVILSPSIIDAIATVELERSVLLRTSDFLQLVESMASKSLLSE